jgi:hypothetical protein
VTAFVEVDVPVPHLLYRVYAAVVTQLFCGGSGSRWIVVLSVKAWRYGGDKSGVIGIGIVYYQRDAVAKIAAAAA